MNPVINVPFQLPRVEVGGWSNKKPTPMNRLEKVTMRTRTGSGQNQFSFVDGVHK